MQIKRFTFWTASLLAVAMLWGCGSNGSGGSDAEPMPTPETVETLGITNCAQCHDSQNESWLEGRHANTNTSPGGPHEGDSYCGVCHNNLNDSFLMPEAYGETVRDVIGCESCHGGGSAHRGIGMIPEPNPGVDTCLSCHADFDEETGTYTAMYDRDGHDAGAVEVFGYVQSGHADAPRDRSSRSDTVGCNRCHSDEGAKLYKHLNTIDDITDADGRGRGAMPLGEENISSIQCRTCHDPHDTSGNSLLMDETVDETSTVVASSQYNTCNHCHAGDNEELNYHAGHDGDDGLLDRQINDTHYDDPATRTNLEGYIIRTAEDTACSDCHDVHSADLTINNQWGLSGHGGEILKFKAQAGADSGFEVGTDEYAAAVIEAGMPEEPAVAGEIGVPAFIHGGWSSSCQRCHTSTGASNFLDDPENYDPAENDFSHIPSYVTDDEAEGEMIYCWACHDNAGAGTLRDPEAITTDYGAEMPNIANSNVCVACHSGRVGGNELADVADFTDARFQNSHYMAAAGVLYNEVGFEYDVDGDPTTDDYANVPYFAHDQIGNLETVDIEDHGEVIGQEIVGAGPCVGCHMSDDTGHTFEPIITDDEGVVTLPAVCSTCHNTTDPEGSHYFSAEILLDEQHEYHEAIEMLGDALGVAGHPYLGGYPYFAQSDWTNGGTVDGEMMMGAAFNFNMLHHEPGAYAHNRYYAKRLLFDSLDFLDGDNYDTTGETPEAGTDGNRLDGIIVIDAATYPGAAVWLGADESGVAERP